MSWMSTPFMREPRGEGVPEILPAEVGDLGLPQGGGEDAPDEMLAVLGPSPDRVGNTHGLLRREGRARSTATRSSLIGT
jgi:hypothetical protein